MECTIYLADACNLCCTYCYEGKKKNLSYMTLDTFEEILDFIMLNKREEDDVVYMTFLGGEPLLNRELLFNAIEMIDTEFKNKIKFRYSITTNATLLDDESIEFLINNNFNLSISVDGDEETHNLNRRSTNGANLYPLVTNNIKKLLDKSAIFNIRMTITANNVHKFFHNIKYFYEMGIDQIYIGCDFFAEWDENTLKVFDTQLDLIDDFYIQYIEPCDKKIVNIYDHMFSTFIVDRKSRYCSAGTKEHYTITSTGEIYPCGYVANIEKGKWSLGNINNSENFNNFFERAKNSVIKKSKCTDCDIRFACNAAKCGFKNYLSTGFLNKPSDVMCKMEKILYKHEYLVISKLYKMRSKRLINNIKLAEKYGLQLSKVIIEIMGEEN